jgi:ribosomal protein S1
MKSESEVDVVIRELSRGGFLVDFMGLRGFIPLSQADGELAKSGERASGRRVKVKILEVDREANRLVFSQVAGGVSASQKEALAQIEVGKTYKAEVTGVAPFGAFVSVKVGDASLPGLIHISEIAWEKVENTTDYVKTGQTIEAKVIGVDTKLGKLTLSLKQLMHDPWQDVTKVFTVDQTVKGTVTKMSQFGAFVSLLPGIEGLIHISKIAPGEEPKAGAEIECLIEEINPDKRKISLSMVSHAKPIGYR